MLIALLIPLALQVSTDFRQTIDEMLSAELSGLTGHPVTYCLPEYDKAPMDAALDLTEPLRVVPSEPLQVQLIQFVNPTATLGQHTAPALVIDPSRPSSFESKFSLITTLSLGKRKNAVLVNVRVCSLDSKPSLLPQEQLILAASDLSMLTTTQAAWLLTQKAGRDWAMQSERWGTFAIALSAAAKSLPYVAMAIPLLQQFVDFVKGQKPDISPFLAEMLPAKIPLGAVGSGTECATGSMFAAKKGNKV